MLTLVMLNMFMFCTCTLLPNSYPRLVAVNLHHSRCKLVFSVRVENSVDPDQRALLEAS